MLDRVLPRLQDNTILLLIDTCAERASLALFRGQEQTVEHKMREREASTTLGRAVHRVLEEGRVPIESLGGVGILSGPGSFTGIRIGLAFAKGLCEAAQLPLAAVSRLEVLAESVHLNSGIALIEAGRDQVYARAVPWLGGAVERLVPFDEIAEGAAGRRMAVVSSVLEEKLTAFGADVTCVDLEARHALPAVQRCLALGGSDIARVEGNYVRGERSIYTRFAGVA